MNDLSRRKFLKISTAAVGAVAASGAVLKAAQRAAQKPSAGVQKIPTFCDICFWKCGAIAYLKEGELWKIEGNPEDPLSR